MLVPKYGKILSILILYARKKVLDFLTLILFNESQPASIGLFSLTNTSPINFNDATLVHLHWINGLVFPLWRIRNINKPIIWQLHDPWPFVGITHLKPRLQQTSNQYFAGLTNQIFKRYVRYCLGKKLKQQTLFLLVSSTHMRKEIISSGLVEEKNITVCPLPLPNYPTARSNIELPKMINEGQKILFVSGLRPYDKNKNMDLAIKSALLYCNDTHSSVLIAGRPHKCYTNNHNHIHNLGFVDRNDLFSLYRYVDVVLISSYFESYCQVALESLISGTPIVCLKGSGVDSLPFKKLIHVVEGDSIACFSRAIAQAASDKQFLSSDEIHQRVSLHNAAIKERYLCVYDRMTR